MQRIDGRVLATAVVGLFLVGGALGFVVAGAGVGPLAPASGSTQMETPDSSTAVPTATPTDVPATATVATASPTATATAVPTATPTQVPTPTPTVESTATPGSRATQTRTPMLIRRFDTDAIEAELRRLLDDWREQRGLRPFGNVDGNLVADLNEMATDHSVAMADEGETIHTIDNRSSADRYREHGLYWTCRFQQHNKTNIITADDNQLEVLAKTYAGTTYQSGAESTDYNANETAVAEDIFEKWTTREPFRQRLSYRNATRIGIGIETTRKNEVYVTGNLCDGSFDDSSEES